MNVTAYYLGLGSSFGLNRVTDSVPYPAFTDTNYDEQFVTLGTLIDHQGAPSHALFKGRPSLELGYNRVNGNADTLASRIDQFDLRLGWKQNFLRYLFAQPKGHVGVSFNEINFGDGTRPEARTALMAGVGLTAGIELPVSSSLTAELTGTYFVENAIGGRPRYRSEGFLFGVQVRVNTGKKT